MIRRIRRKKPGKQEFHRRTSPGAAPGTLVSDASAGATRIHVIQYDSEQASERDLTSVEEIPAPAPDGVLWVNVVGLGDAGVIERIGKRFALHPLALEDVLHVHQRAKAEPYEGHFFVVMRMLTGAETGESEQISMFFGHGFVVTFQERPGDCFDPVRTRIRQRGRIRGKRSDYLAYALLDALIDAYFPVLEALGVQLDELDEAITDNHGRNVMNTLHLIRRRLILLRKLLWQLRDAVNTLVRDEEDLILEETQIYLRDCFDHVVQLIDVTEADRETCVGLQELALAELSQQSNDVMKVLTMFAAVFMPMSLVAGVYGMNFDPDASPYNLPELRWLYGYPFALGSMGVIALGLLFYFYRQGWLKR